MKTREELETMTREQLTQYSREKGIRLFTKVPKKMIEKILEIEYIREHHGDAFRK